MFKLNKKGMSLLEVLIVVLLVAGLASMAYPAYLSSVEKAKASEAVQLVGHTVSAQRQYFEENEVYADKFSDLSFEVKGRDVTVDGATATTANFTYTLGAGNVTATHKSNSKYTYTIIGEYHQDAITCKVGTNSTDDTKICSTLGKSGDNGGYIIE